MFYYHYILVLSFIKKTDIQLNIFVSMKISNTYLIANQDRFIVELYISDAEVIKIAIKLMLIAAVFQLSDGIQVVALGVLRGITDVNIPTWITMFAYWGVALPLGYFLGFTLKLDAIGIWIGLLAGLTISAILLTFRFYHLIKIMKKVDYIHS